MVDPRNFILNSDFPMDQIVGFLSGSMTVANGALDTVDVPHGLTFSPLPLPSWSYQADFSESFLPRVDYNGTGVRPSVTMQANDSVLRVTVDNQTGSSKTIYWRCFFLLPSGVDPAVAATAIQSLPLTFNSDYNYTKLLKDGYETASTSVPHDLGYRPQVQCWSEYPSGFIQMYDLSDAIASPLDSVEVTTSALIITKSATFAGVHYRIYADEA